GWTWSKGFSDAALTDESRKALASSCIEMFIKGNLPLLDGDPAGGTGAAAGVFDGIDIDWEYPAAAGNDGTVFRPEDTANFTALLAEFRRQLNAIDPRLLLTIAAPAGQDKIDKIEAGRIHESLNWINLMTYDMHGAWDRSGPTNFHAPLYASPNDPSTGIAKQYSADAAVSAYLAAGVPANKVVIGVPFYGRGWTGVPNVNDGLHQSSPQISPAPGTYEAGIEDYKVLKALGAPGHRDTVTQAYWTFSNSTFWSYDDPIAIATKMAYVKSKNLLGAMVWELDGDTPDGELLNAVASGLR
ncbi:MAG TPA: glycoside hydrolase family 18 protein, partial [Polyangiaceae bacterium]|nr:glycoside hydrolase family 18 protein [Polyangiaceae bacterium]